MSELHAMVERNAFQLRQLRESMARMIDGAAAEARRLGLRDVADLLHEASETARQGRGVQGDASAAAPWQARMR